MAGHFSPMLPHGRSCEDKVSDRTGSQETSRTRATARNETRLPVDFNTHARI
jgi:hypothetical protein